MKILLSGASSFTGFWFARELRQRGHEVACLFQALTAAAYEGRRAWRVAQLVREGRAVFGCSFGSPEFLALLDEGWEVYGHHAAEVTNYRGMDFDVLGAVAKNIRNLRLVLQRFREGGGQAVLLTGSVFEPGEGVGSEGLPAILPYGLSKGLTSQVFLYEAALAQVRLGKFVIPNPFGVHQEPRFVQYLLGAWKRGETARVGTPAYVRDNIPVCLLARDYRHFLETLPQAPPVSQRRPSGLVGDQASFARLVAEETRARLGWACRLEIPVQTEFSEPLVRLNDDPAARRHPDWSLAGAWDALAREAQDEA